MKVWRIEHKDSGLGPWRHRPYRVGIDAFLTTLSENVSIKHDPDNHPGPDQDGHSLQQAFERSYLCLNGYHFGFPSLSMARYWFNNKRGREAMTQIGFVLHQYEVPKSDVLIGNTQIAFRKQRATLLQERVLS